MIFFCKEKRKCRLVVRRELIESERYKKEKKEKENRKLERVSYHFYSYFGMNYFDVLLPTFYFFIHHSGMSCDVNFVFHIFKDIKNV